MVLLRQVVDPEEREIKIREVPEQMEAMELTAQQVRLVRQERHQCWMYFIFLEHREQQVVMEQEEKEELAEAVAVARHVSFVITAQVTAAVAAVAAVREALVVPEVPVVVALLVPTSMPTEQTLLSLTVRS